MFNNKVEEIGRWRSAWTARPLTQVKALRDLPDLPVFPETLLRMELKASERSVNLSEISELVLGDIGASLQILRLAGREFIFAPDRPTRIEDCIAALGTRACLEAISKQVVRRDGRACVVIDTWIHSRTIAEFCAYLAETHARVLPHEAYFVGLFHELGSLPNILGWDGVQGISGRNEVGSLSLAESWSLPDCVVEYFCELSGRAIASRWSGIVQRAHRMLDDVVKSADSRTVAFHCWHSRGLSGAIS